MQEKFENRFLRREFRPIGWMLIAYFMLMNVFVIGTMMLQVMSALFDSVAQGVPYVQPDQKALSSNGWGYVLAMAVGMLILFVWKDRSFWREEVFSRKGKMTVGAFFALLCLTIAPQMINTIWVAGLEAVMNLFDRSLIDLLESVSGSSDSVSMFLYVSILAPISEELIFRGWIQGSLRPYGRKFAILGSAILFGLFHGNLIQTPYAFLVGLVLGYVSMEYSIWWAIALHMFNNLVFADLFTRLLTMLPEMLGSLLNLGVLTAFASAGIVILAVKRNAIRNYLYGEYLDRKCLKWFLLNSGFIALAILMALNGMTMFME